MPAFSFQALAAEICLKNFPKQHTVRESQLMSREALRALLLITAGVILTAGTIAAQFANAIVKAGFHASGSSGVIPPAPSAADPHMMVVAAAAILVGIAFMSYSKD